MAHSLRRAELLDPGEQISGRNLQRPRQLEHRLQGRAALARLNPQNRLVTPEEVAEAVAFLCRPDALGVTGQSLIIAGGEVM